MNLLIFLMFRVDEDLLISLRCPLIGSHPNSVLSELEYMVLAYKANIKTNRIKVG